MTYDPRKIDILPGETIVMPDGSLIHAKKVSGKTQGLLGVAWLADNGVSLIFECANCKQRGTINPGDYECFVFDRHQGPEEHGAADVPEDEDPDACRVYPEALLPEGVRGVKGKWIISVSFEPDA